MYSTEYMQVGGKLLFRLDGSSGSPELEKAWLICADKVFKLWKDRQKKYGPKNIAKTGEVGILIRLNDKIERLNNLIINRKGEEANDEAAVDTWLDAADYPIICLMVLYGLWPDDPPHVTKSLNDHE